MGHSRESGGRRVEEGDVVAGGERKGEITSYLLPKDKIGHSG